VDGELAADLLGQLVLRADGALAEPVVLADGGSAAWVGDHHAKLITQTLARGYIASREWVVQRVKLRKVRASSDASS
jgi:hypothetical protein